jgi:hypothetical protein
MECLNQKKSLAIPISKIDGAVASVPVDGLTVILTPTESFAMVPFGEAWRLIPYPLRRVMI